MVNVRFSFNSSEAVVQFVKGLLQIETSQWTTTIAPDGLGGVCVTAAIEDSSGFRTTPKDSEEQPSTSIKYSSTGVTDDPKRYPHDE